jgi:spore maturation protein CgeB
MRILIAGSLGYTSVGDSLVHAANGMGHETLFSDTSRAYGGPRWWQVVNWRFLHHRPSTLLRYNGELRDDVTRFRPNVLLTTGTCPVTAETLRFATNRGTVAINYSTDDPWNRASRTKFFFRSLTEYDIVFSPRRSTLGELRAAGVRRVEYLPFAYDPRFAHPTDVPAGAERPDILFVGGGDRDRYPILGRLVAEGFRVAIYGSYWDRYRPTKSAVRGIAQPEALCRTTSAAKISLCLVRRANRDGHVMRTFEMAAIGTCILAEDTDEQRAVLGDGAIYFTTPDEMVARCRELLADDDRRAALASAARRRITTGPNTYADRLGQMLAGVESITGNRLASAPLASGDCSVKR